MKREKIVCLSEMSDEKMHYVHTHTHSPIHKNKQQCILTSKAIHVNFVFFVKLRSHKIPILLGTLYVRNKNNERSDFDRTSTNNYYELLQIQINHSMKKKN